MDLVDGDQAGPLAKFISFDQARAIAEWHHWVFNGLLGLIALHLAAIVFHAVVKRDNLVGPMLTGAKSHPGDPAPMTPAPPWRLAAALVVATIVTWLIVKG